MLYPLIIQTLANEQLEETRRHAEHVRRIRQAWAENGPAPRAVAARKAPRLFMLRVAGPATRFPR